MGCSDLDSDTNIIKSLFFLFMKTCFEVDFQNQNSCSDKLESPEELAIFCVPQSGLLIL